MLRRGYIVRRRVSDSNDKLKEYLLGALHKNGLESFVTVAPWRDGYRLYVGDSESAPFLYADVYLDGNDFVIERSSKRSLAGVEVGGIARFLGMDAKETGDLLVRFRRFVDALYAIDHHPVSDLHQVRVEDSAARCVVCDAGAKSAEFFMDIREAIDDDSFLVDELMHYLSSEDLDAFSMWLEKVFDLNNIEDAAPVGSVRLHMMQAIEGLSAADVPAVLASMTLTGVLHPMGIGAVIGESKDTIVLPFGGQLVFTPDEEVIFSHDGVHTEYLIWDLNSWVDAVKAAATGVQQVSDGDSGDLLAMVSRAVSMGYTYDKNASMVSVIEGAKTYLKEHERGITKTEGAEKQSDSASAERSDFIFPASSGVVNDGKGHYPLNSVARGRAALAMAAKTKTLPAWYSGDMSLSEFKKHIRSEVQKAFPSIEVSMDDKD